MAGPKTRLMRGESYGLLKAAELAAEMIAQYERKRTGAFEIRVESLGDGIWDDISVVYEHSADKWQVKRLMQSLDGADARKIIIAASAPNARVPTTLHLGVAHLVPVHEAGRPLFGLHELAELCQEAQKPGVDVADFVRIEGRRSAYKFVETCIPTAPPGDIIATLQRLHVVDLGLEDRLRSQAVNQLQDLFTNAEDVVRQLHHWFLERPDGTIAVTLPLLYEHVIEPYGKRDPSRPRWIHLTRDAVKPQWQVRGPLAVRKLVEGAWGAAGRVRMELNAKPFGREATSACLARLMLHQSPGGVTEADAPGWQAHSHALCAGTLGISASVPLLNCTPIGRTPVQGAREDVPESELAELLSSQMDTRVWDAYSDDVTQRLSETEIAADLRVGMQALWSAWHSGLPPAQRAGFIRSMLATAEEARRDDFQATVRSGLLLVEQLARATIVALAIAATLRVGGISSRIASSSADRGVDNLHLGTVVAHIIALNAASHPGDRRARPLSHDTGALLSHEAGMAILGAVEASSAQIFAVACQAAVPFHSSDVSSQHYHQAGRPFPILTAGPLFYDALRTGIAAMQQHLGQVLASMNDGLVSSLREAVEEKQTNG